MRDENRGGPQVPAALTEGQSAPAALNTKVMRTDARVLMSMFGGGAADAMDLARAHLLAADEIDRLRAALSRATASGIGGK